MKKIFFILVYILPSAGAKAQGFWAPGACWVYEQLHVSPYLFVGMYTGDTVINGIVAQERTFRTCLLSWASGGGLDTNCLSNTWSRRDYGYQQGDIVYSKGDDPAAAWDTLYYLGVPGDRWWPAHYTYPLTCGTFGMLEIQDTGHVVIDGVNLRTWSLAYLDSAGTSTWGNEQFLGADTLAIIERIGGMLPWYTCDPVDQPAFRLRHYSDQQMTTGDGPACDIVLSSPSTLSSHNSIFPNPGTDVITLSGSRSGPTKIEVRGALGRLILSQSLPPSRQLDTSDWPAGTYFLSLISEKGEREVFRWMKQ